MMQKLSYRFRHLMPLTAMVLALGVDAMRFLQLCLRLRPILAAENFLLRKQLALYQERHVKPQRATHATRLALIWLGHWFDWRTALAIVTPQAFLRWHRQGCQLFWRWKSRRGRPQIPAELQALIHRMALENPTWGQERIANALLLKLGLQVSPRTVRTYMPKRLDRGPGNRTTLQRWSTFVRNHTQAIVACDFCVTVTATFRMLYVFVGMEHAPRRILHIHITAHPTNGRCNSCVRRFRLTTRIASSSMTATASSHRLSTSTSGPWGCACCKRPHTVPKPVPSVNACWVRCGGNAWTSLCRLRKTTCIAF
jgi:hypothetical protein